MAAVMVYELCSKKMNPSCEKHDTFNSKIIKRNECSFCRKVLKESKESEALKECMWWMTCRKSD